MRRNNAINTYIIAEVMKNIQKYKEARKNAKKKL
jgi:hypothetical protein